MDEKKCDDEAVLDHMALECMHAIEAKDKEAFRDCFEMLVTDIVNRLSDEMEGDMKS